MRLRHLVARVVVGLGIFAAGSVLAEPAPGSGAVRVQRAEILDRSGFEKPLVAATVMIPVGWKSEGGIVWRQNTSGCGENTPHFAWRATAPDGVGAVEILPEQSWSGNNVPMQGAPPGGCPNVWITSAREYLAAWVENYRPGARVLEYRDRPDFVKALNDQIAQQPPLVMTGSETRQWAEGGQVTLAYTTEGEAVHEIVGLSVLFNLMRMQGVTPGQVAEYITMTSFPGFAVRARAGKLDAKQAEMLRKSARPAPEWQARMAQHNAKIAGIQRRGAMERSRIIAKHGDEMREMQRDSWEKQQASSDRLQRERVESIRGTETYDDPRTGGTVELDSSYEHAWQLDDGTFVLTDDASFDPFQATGQGGQALEVTR